MIHVDLKSRVIPEDHQVFLVRPGSNYKLMPLFEQKNGIFADLLGLELANHVPLDEQKNIVGQLHRARKLRGYRRLEEQEPPSRDLEDYSEYVSDRGISQLNRILSGFFKHAKKGDVVVVPPRAFAQDALLGELLDEPTSMYTATFPELYGNERLYGRRVQWLSKIKKGKLSPYILDLGSRPNAFVLLPRAERLPIYREAYGSYILPGEFRARFNVDDPEFTTTDDLYIQAFFNFVAANSKRIETDQNVVSIYKAAFEELGDHSIELQSNINSPGFLNLISGKVSPLVATALFAVAIQIGPEALQAAESGTILVGNSLDAGDPCTVAINQEVLQHLRLLGIRPERDCQGQFQSMVAPNGSTLPHPSHRSVRSMPLLPSPQASRQHHQFRPSRP